jgi:hypothetical protein
MKQTIILIYGLVDPTDQSVFYVGRTQATLKRRIRGHLKDSKTSNNPKCQRIREMAKRGVAPQIIELARLINPSLEEAESAEQAWIDFYDFSYTLTNSKPASAGGIGCSNGIKYEWTPKILAQLGKVSDTAIARQLGCSQTAVADQRIKLRIPKFTEQKWTPEVLSRLGKEPDTQIAKDMGVAQSVVSQKRIELRISAYQPVQWTQEVIAKLGTVPDSAIAEELGCHASAVSFKRRKLGIKPYGRPIKPSKRTTPAWNKTSLPDWVTEKLGTLTDAELSILSGFTHRVIHSARIRLGIPSYSELMGHPTRFGVKTREVEGDCNSPIEN